jgi:PEGA domain
MSIKSCSRSFISLSLAALVVSAMTTSAFAGDREDAAKEFDLGQQSEKAGNAAAALDHYLRSYELVPHAATAYNIAVNYEKLGKARQAAQYFASYLEQDADASDREKVKTKIANLADLPSRIVVRSSPPGAILSVDGGPDVREPIVLSMKGGEHQIVATLQTQKQTQKVNAQYGEPQEILITFGADTAVINIWSTVSNSSISVDGAVVGTAPIAVTVPSGKHTVSASAPGFVPQTKPVTVSPGLATQLSFSLVRAGQKLRPNIGATDPQPQPDDSSSGLAYSFGIMSGTFLVPDQESAAVGLNAQAGIRFGNTEFFASVLFSGVTDPGDTEPGTSVLIKGGTTFGFGARRSRFAAKGISLHYGGNIFFDGTTFFDFRVGLIYSNIINGGIKGDFIIESGVGAVPRDVGASAYVPILAGLMFHN